MGYPDIICEFFQMFLDEQSYLNYLKGMYQFCTTCSTTYVKAMK